MKTLAEFKKEFEHNLGIEGYIKSRVDDLARKTKEGRRPELLDVIGKGNWMEYAQKVYDSAIEVIEGRDTLIEYLDLVINDLFKSVDKWYEAAQKKQSELVDAEERISELERELVHTREKAEFWQEKFESEREWVLDALQKVGKGTTDAAKILEDINNRAADAFLRRVS